MREGTAEGFFTLQEQGRYVFVHTDGDGEFWLRLYVDEAAPEQCKQYSINHIILPCLKAPSGMLYYTDCEYVGNNACVSSAENICLYCVCGA